MIGSRIKKLRNEKGISLSQLAERAGVAKSYLSSIERDIQSNPSLQFIEKIAQVLDVPMNVLIENDSLTEHDLDDEWSQLVLEAMRSGVSKEEFRGFLEFQKWKLAQNKE
ncbi:helix-turn-helix domain-containing protein [Brevibacillus choshinensis]|uniref:Helix-turn-helix domain-containing protein n=1 Tax=Brevibacillus choshinensis TaxID=54911 RepID=A0ABX7FJD2_BRECH|nr:helix-turn-helix domain-containing protein [Brevibacillus choshinensis]QRG66242.1 helix-turn-helix domain-containing protein [Brevibacillus choshinensis]